jgi:hypothetical protein
MKKRNHFLIRQESRGLVQSGRIKLARRFGADILKWICKDQTGWNRGNLSSLNGIEVSFFYPQEGMDYHERVSAAFKKGLALFSMDINVAYFRSRDRSKPAQTKSIS